MPFDHLGLVPTLLSNIKAAGYSIPTPIQEATIPLVLKKHDVLGCAQTGTGKTAAFALPILQNLSEKPVRNHQTIRALILTPTRELAQQIYDCFVLYGRSMPVHSCVVFGGVGQPAQVDALKAGCDVLVACPGRLLDLMNQGIVQLDHVSIFVLDEADRMLDMGFIHDVRRIAQKLPSVHQTLLFSATMPQEVEALALDLLRNPQTVKVDPVSSTVKAIDQYMYYVDKANKKRLLASILKQDDVVNALVFSRTKYGCDRIVRDLKKAGLEAVAIHGDKSQGARTSALSRFKSGECPILVATDIAARGLDIEGLSHVINYDLPMEPEAYVHRIGRTGRAGRGGTAISFCCIDEYKQLGQVEKLLGFRLPVHESDWPMEITTPTVPAARPPRPSKRPADVTVHGEAVVSQKKSGPRNQQTHGTHSSKQHAPAVPSKLAKPVQRTNRRPAR